ncbi:Sister chromatid cohesion protein DCC1 [Holothuria leucospilota]|uniref:Sister chromatid cohesion protein DCC1 n=1 Tax=Holothuria leucospilota TaxID=206669 RepID=A0A9Q1H2M7_HOLLE|nr:Sister chromatid cohesion protein DCC1 [Holothuria leucospilota]
MKLIEVDSAVMAYVEEGKDLVIRGDKTESAVMCLEDMTFDLKEAETSNTLLLLDKCLGVEDFEEDGPDLHHFQIQGVAHKYLELRPMRPKLQKLRLLLNQNPYAGDLYEDSPEHSGQKFTMEDLLGKVQASKREIIEQLKQIRACCIKGFWRLLDFDYEFEVLSQILSLMEENSWSMDWIPLEETLDTLEELKPRLIVQHVMDCFGEKTSNPESEDESKVTYKLNEDRICRLYAEMLLKHTDKFNLVEFLQAWQQSVPEGMNTSEDQLKGLALIDRASKPQVISLFKTSSLPENERDRFNFLFKTKERWTMDEISPYLEDLAEGKLKIGALLQKYARTSVGPGGVRVYNSKRPIT